MPARRADPRTTRHLVGRRHPAFWHSAWVWELLRALILKLCCYFWRSSSTFDSGSFRLKVRADREAVGTTQFAVACRGPPRWGRRKSRATLSRLWTGRGRLLAPAVAQGPDSLSSRKKRVAYPHHSYHTRLLCHASLAPLLHQLLRRSLEQHDQSQGCA